MSHRLTFPEPSIIELVASVQALPVAKAPRPLSVVSAAVPPLLPNSIIAAAQYQALHKPNSLSLSQLMPRDDGERSFRPPVRQSVRQDDHPRLDGRRRSTSSSSDGAGGGATKEDGDARDRAASGRKRGAGTSMGSLELRPSMSSDTDEQSMQDSHFTDRDGSSHPDFVHSRSRPAQATFLALARGPYGVPQSFRSSAAHSSQTSLMHPAPLFTPQVFMTSLSSVHGHRVVRYLGPVQLHFIKESWTIRNSESLGSFFHVFASEVMHVARFDRITSQAHVT